MDTQANLESIQRVTKALKALGAAFDKLGNAIESLSELADELRNAEVI